MNDGGPVYPVVAPATQIRCAYVYEGQTRHQSLAETAMGRLIPEDYSLTNDVQDSAASAIRRAIIEHALAFADDMLAAEERRAKTGTGSEPVLIDEQVAGEDKKAPSVEEMETKLRYGRWPDRSKAYVAKLTRIYDEVFG